MRTSAVLMLVATLLASQAAGFACILDCGEPQAQALETSVASSCHREAQEPPASPFALTAASHTCESHSTGGPVLTAPRAFAAHGSTSVQPALFHAGILDVRTPAGRRIISAHDLAPPGSGPRLIAPLRI